MKKILVLILPLVAFIGGAVAGDVLHGEKPADTAPAPAGTEGHAPEPIPDKADAADGWFKFPSQFFVPIMRNGITSGIMVLSLTIEMPEELKPKIEAQEHRLRDALLNALLVQANTGGFDGNFTSEATQERLRKALLDAARNASDPAIKRVLIEDIARQDQ